VRRVFGFDTHWFWVFEKFRIKEPYQFWCLKNFRIEESPGLGIRKKFRFKKNYQFWAGLKNSKNLRVS
jgi:hypothetical protein